MELSATVDFPLNYYVLELHKTRFSMVNSSFLYERGEMYTGDFQGVSKA